MLLAYLVAFSSEVNLVSILHPLVYMYLQQQGRGGGQTKVDKRKKKGMCGGTKTEEGGEEER